MAISPEIKITVYGKTDVGLMREHNEDNFLVVDFAGAQKPSPDASLEFSLGEKGALFLVCDGMGGAAAGEVASNMAVESISSAVGSAGTLSRERFARRVRRAIEDANDGIFAQSRDNQSERGMGTTCTAVGLVDATLLIGQIGDSRCYVLRAGQLSQTTKDQSLAWQLIEAGAMTLEEAKGFEHANIILQALGVQEKVEVVLSQVPLRRGDVVLVCSDGLHGPVSDEEIKRILLDEPDVRKACDQLIACANAHDGPDNITVVLARFDGPGLPEPGADDQVSFLPYDPGQDPEDPEPARRPATPDRVTGDTSSAQELRSTMSDVMAPEEPTANTRRPDAQAAPAQPIPEARSLLAFVLVTLLAALAGALFLVAQRARIPDRNFERASLASHGKLASPSTAPPSPVSPLMLGASDRPADAGTEP
ncbi:MAG: PP2C family serine/threonine-protein phosphatase [Polyangia bacterium]|jgi:serine/threonine protein phosphatase PrpC